MPGTIPLSNALSEASPNSISELMSKDPFRLTVQDRKEIVAKLREQRVRWEAAEAAGQGKPRAARSAKTLETTSSLDDLGL